MRIHALPPSRRRDAARRPSRFIPGVDGHSNRLERRALLATITVNTFLDQTDAAGSGTISLRDAVGRATGLAGATEIDLPAGTYNLTQGQLLVGNTSGQGITIKGLGTAANTIINQTVAKQGILDFDNNLAGNVAGSLINLTFQGVTNAGAQYGGGAIIAGAANDSLVVSGCVFQNNSTTDVGGAIAMEGGNLTVSNSTFAGDAVNGSGSGGAIEFDTNASADKLSISNCTFSGNKLASGGMAGGAVDIYGGSATISGCSFAGNSAGTSAGLGGAISFGGGGTSLAITATNFAGNSAQGGGAIYAKTGTVTVSGSRFAGDSAATGSGIDNAGATVTANNDWWGADAYPGATGTDSVAGTVATASRLTLAFSAAASQVAAGGSTTLTAVVASTSNPGVALAGTALDGLSLAFAPGSLGSVSPTSVVIAGGSASATFAAGPFGGTTSPSVKLDNATKTTTITVVGAPTANAQAVAVGFNAGAAITLTGSDPNSPPLALTYQIIAAPSHGTLSGTAPNLTYTPTAGYHGGDTFAFTVSNGQLTSAAATVSLTVATGTPTSNPQTIAVAHDSPGRAVTLTASDPDVPALPLTFAVATGPAHGTLSGTAPNLIYTPAVGYHGTDSFTYTVSNGTNTASPATVTLNVAAGTPTVAPQAISTNQGTGVLITLADSDDDSPPLAQTFAFTQPAHGTITVVGSAGSPHVLYTPAAGYSGPDSFAYTASNGTNTSTPAIVALTVNPLMAVASGTVGVTWGAAGAASLVTNADGLRLLPVGRNTDLPWLGIKTLSLTLNQAAALAAGDVSITGVNVANYGPVTIGGSGTSYITITLARPINAADRVTLTIGNAGIATFTRRLDVLPGDFNDDGVVTMQDATGIRNEYLGFAAAVPTVFGDINGDYSVDVNDYNLTRRLIGTVLP